MNNWIVSLRDIVDAAITTFNTEETYLLHNDLSERCICARFAMHLTNALKDTNYQDYIVDVEYNRGFDGNERSSKRLYNAPITVDLIVHKRGYDPDHGFNNLICIEMKKSTNRDGCDKDIERIKNMVGFDYGYCYQAGYMMLANMKTEQLEIVKQITQY